MTSKSHISLCHLPEDVVQVIISKFQQIGPALSGRALIDTPTALSSLLKSGSLYRVYRDYLKSNVIKIDALCPFDGISWNTKCLGRTYYLFDRTAEESWLCNKEFEYGGAQKYFREALRYLILQSGGNLKEFRCPLLPHGTELDCPNLYDSMVESQSNLEELYVSEECCQHLQESEKDGYLPSTSRSLVRVLKNSNCLRKFSCSSPSASVLSALKGLSCNLQDLAVKNLHIWNAFQFTDVVKRHKKTLRSVSLMGLGWYANSRPQKEEDLRLLGEEMEKHLINVFDGPQRVHLPKIQSLKIVLGGFLFQRYGTDLCRSLELRLHEKYRSISTVEADYSRNEKRSLLSDSIIDLNFCDLEMLCDVMSLLKQPDEQNMIDQNMDSLVASALEEEEQFQSEYTQHGRMAARDYLSVEEIEQLLPNDRRLPRSAASYSAVANYSKLNSAVIHMSSLRSCMITSRAFRGLLRGIWKEAHLSLNYVWFADVTLESWYRPFRQTCNLMRSCLFYCTGVTHLVIPVSMVQRLCETELGVENTQYLARLASCMRSVCHIRIWASEKNMDQLWTEAELFLQGWPKFLMVIGAKVKSLRSLSFSFIGRCFELDQNHAELLRVAIQETNDFERFYSSVDVHSVKVLLNVWLGNIS